MLEWCCNYVLFFLLGQVMNYYHVPAFTRLVLVKYNLLAKDQCLLCVCIPKWIDLYLKTLQTLQKIPISLPIERGYLIMWIWIKAGIHVHNFTFLSLQGILIICKCLFELVWVAVNPFGRASREVNAELNYEIYTEKKKNEKWIERKLVCRKNNQLWSACFISFKKWVGGAGLSIVLKLATRL